MQRHFRVISYDVASDRRRRRMEKAVLRYAVRVQYSVFEGWLTDRELQLLLDRAARLLDPATDSLRVYPVCAACLGRVRSVGAEFQPHPPAEVIV